MRNMKGKRIIAFLLAMFMVLPFFGSVVEAAEEVDAIAPFEEAIEEDMVVEDEDAEIKDKIEELDSDSKDAKDTSEEEIEESKERSKENNLNNTVYLEKTKAEKDKKIINYDSIRGRSFSLRGYTGSDLVDSLSVNTTDISHTGDFQVILTFSGQSENSGKDRYIYSGKEIFIPIEGDGVAEAQLNSKLPEIANAEVIADGGGIRITFLEGIEGQHDIEGYLRLTFSGLNTEEDSTHTLTIGGEHVVNISNTKAGDKGVFAGKTGMMYGESNPGYVTWFLRGNINGDALPGGPLKIHDKLGEGQVLDGTGIKIGLYWGGQQHQTYSKIYNSIEEFLNDPDYGSSKGSKIDYNKEEGTIDIEIPEEVLNGREFSFTYDALITDFDLDEFTNEAKFDFFEDKKPGNIENNGIVTNIDAGGGITGKTRASININKVIAGTETPIAGVQFKVSRKDGGPLFQGKEDREIILTTDKNGQIRKSGFKPGIMILKEVSAPDGIEYDPQEQIELDIKANNNSEINRIENEIKKIDIPVRKAWEDNDNQDGIRPESVTIKLLADGVDTGKTLTLNETNNWTGTFTELDEYKEGKKIEYTVEEVEVDGYETVVTGDAETGFTVTNTHQVEKIDIEGSKTWVDNDNQDGKRPESITIKLLANGKEVDSKEVTGDDWTWKFENLDKFKNGEEITYKISEDKVEGYSTEVKGYNVTNSYTPGKTSVQVTKAWKDNNDQDGIRPESVTIKLIADGKETDKIVLSEENNWIGTFSELDEYKEGKKIEYTVEEVEVDGYKTSISGDMDSDFVITNTHEVEKIDISGSKTWNDNNNQDGKRPETITVNLLKNGIKLDSKTVSEKDDWSWTFKDLDKFEDGQEIVYTITEDKVENYTTEINEYNITNSYTPGKTSVQVTKTWDDENDYDRIRPDTITIKLLADGKVTDKKLVLSEDNDWSDAFTNLDEYKNGEKIIYTVEEVEVEGYKTIINGDADEGFSIINKHDPETVEVSVTKKWVGTQEDSVTINLLANDKKVDSVELTEENDWTHTFTDLRKLDDKGKEIVYKVSEVEIEGYIVEITGDMDTGFIVTNTRKPIIPQTPTKPTEPTKPVHPKPVEPKPVIPSTPSKPANPIIPQTSAAPKTGDLGIATSLMFMVTSGMALFGLKKKED